MIAKRTSVDDGRGGVVAEDFLSRSREKRVSVVFVVFYVNVSAKNLNE
jgi:hypothetical protein